MASPVRELLIYYQFIKRIYCHGGGHQPKIKLEDYIIFDNILFSALSEQFAFKEVMGQ
jgi:hypothetical protein